MKRVVGLMHRQAVKAKAEGLFFKVSTLDMFKGILADQKALPREQPYKDLVSLINFILRKFFKALEAEPFLAIEVFFPKNRGHWKQYSSWEAEGKGKGAGGKAGGAGGGRGSRGGAASNPNAQEVVVKKGYSWTDQMGIAIAALVDAGKKSLVTWTQELLKSVVEKRNRIVEETDQKSDDEEEDDNDDAMRLKGPSADAIAKFEDEVIPYLSNDHAEAASKNVHLKLLFRLCKFFLRDEDADEDDELEWYIPQAILPSELEQCCNVIAQFLESPFELGGKKASELMQKKRRRRTRRQRSPSASGDEGDALSDAPARRQKRKKKEKEQVQYKSAQFIEDSDEEYGDMEAFMERERLQREKAQLAAALGGDTSKPLGMKAKGTKKRRKRKGKGKGADADADAGREGEDGGSGGAAAAVGESSRPASRNHGSADSDEGARGSGLGDGEDEEDSDGGSAPDPHASAKSSDVEDGASDAPSDVDDTPVSRPRPKPRPRPVLPKRKASRSPGADGAGSGGSSPPRSEAVEEPELAVSERGSPDGSEDGGEAVRTARRTKRLVLSDSDEE